MSLFKWKVAPEPKQVWAGESSFGMLPLYAKREWPTAYYPDGHPAMKFDCADPYGPNRAKSGEHAPLHLYIANYQDRDRVAPGPGEFEWSLVATPVKMKMDELKLYGAAFLTRNRKFMPHLYRDFRIELKVRKNRIPDKNTHRIAYQLYWRDREYAESLKKLVDEKAFMHDPDHTPNEQRRKLFVKAHEHLMLAADFAREAWLIDYD